MKKITIFILAFAPFMGIAQKGTKDITILHTNDFHSAFDPIPAYWLKGSPNLGGAAALTTMINQIREKEKTSEPLSPPSASASVCSSGTSVELVPLKCEHELEGDDAGWT